MYVEPTTEVPMIPTTVVPTIPPTTHAPTTQPPIDITVIPSELAPNPLTVETISINSGLCSSYNGTEFILRGLPTLRHIVIGDDCFGTVRLFELNGLSKLESVVIGKKSFTYAKTDDDIMFYVTRTDGTYRSVNCPKLKSIQIGEYSFGDYHSFELGNSPSLQSIDIGEDCFYWTLSFSLTGSFE